MRQVKPVVGIQYSPFTRPPPTDQGQRGSRLPTASIDCSLFYLWDHTQEARSRMKSTRGREQHRSQSMETNDPVLSMLGVGQKLWEGGPATISWNASGRKIRPRPPAPVSLPARRRFFRRQYGIAWKDIRESNSTRRGICPSHSDWKGTESGLIGIGSVSTAS